jgi:hypothetical protein
MEHLHSAILNPAFAGMTINPGAAQHPYLISTSPI